MAGFSPGVVARRFAGPCEQPEPQTCGAWALRSLRSQAVRFSGRMERRWITEKIFGEDAPHSGQFAGALDWSRPRSFVNGPHASQWYS